MEGKASCSGHWLQKFDCLKKPNRLTDKQHRAALCISQHSSLGGTGVGGWVSLPCHGYTLCSCVWAPCNAWAITCRCSLQSVHWKHSAKVVFCWELFGRGVMMSSSCNTRRFNWVQQYTAFPLPIKQCSAATGTGRVSVPQVSIKSKLIMSTRRTSIFHDAKTQMLIISNL